MAALALARASPSDRQEARLRAGRVWVEESARGGARFRCALPTA